MEADTKEVVRIDSYVDSPPNFTLKAAKRSVVDKRVSIAGRDYTLPFHSEVRRWDGTHAEVSGIDYKAYHKYEVTSGMRIDAEAKGPKDATPAPASASAQTVAGKSSSEVAPPAKSEQSVETMVAGQPPSPKVAEVASSRHFNFVELRCVHR